MKKCLFFFFSLVIISSISGCGQVYSQKGIGSQMVQEIQIHCDNCSGALDLRCTEPEGVRTILLCIRALGPDFPARTNVDALTGKTLTITLRCTDGSWQVYRIRNNQYLQKNNGPWRQINMQNASGLYQLLLTLADEPSAEARDPLSGLSPADRIYSPALRGMEGE